MKCSNHTLSKRKTSHHKRHPRPSVPQRWSDHLYVEVDRADIAMFKFILESYDNLAYLSVLDKYKAMVRLTFSPDATRHIHALLHDLTAAGEIAIRRVIHLNQSTAQSRTGCQETC